jgi:adenylylsulfate kinase
MNMQTKQMEAISDQKNVTWFNGFVSPEDREKLHGHRGAVVWFTGLSGSGKSTIAHIVEKQLHQRGCSTFVLDGDNVRHGLCADLGFSAEDRKENIRRIGEVVNLFVEAGIIVLTAFISPYREDRQKVRSLLNGRHFLEIYVECPPDVCAQRDKKNIYARAKAGLIKNFTGISAPYEVPESPDLTIPSHRLSKTAAADYVLNLLTHHKIIQENSALKS